MRYAPKHLFFCFRVDPSAKADDNSSTPVEHAVFNECEEALEVLLEFVEIPDQVKFEQLTRLMNSGGNKSKTAFAEMLRTMPVDLVKPKISLSFDQHSCCLGEHHHQCERHRNIAAGCHTEQKARLCSHLAGIWVCLLGNHKMVISIISGLTQLPFLMLSRALHWI